MSPINYSKWDSLELSDDSDTECQPATGKEINNDSDSKVVPTSGPSQPNSTSQDESTNNNPQDEPTDSAAEGSIIARSEHARDDENDDLEELEELIPLTPAARAFCKIKSSDYAASYLAIRRDHSLFIDTSITLALLGEAFEALMKDRNTYAKNCVHQSILLKQCQKLFYRERNSVTLQKILSGELTPPVPMDEVNMNYGALFEGVSLLKGVLQSGRSA